jgi:hypothetical protein
MYLKTRLQITSKRISGVMVSVLVSSAIDCGFEPQSDQIKEYEIGMCCFSGKHTALRRKSKNSLDRNQDNVSEKCNEKLLCWH